MIVACVDSRFFVSIGLDLKEQIEIRYSKTTYLTYRCEITKEEICKGRTHLVQDFFKNGADSIRILVYFSKCNI